jgi:glutamine cyclotransferase
VPAGPGHCAGPLAPCRAVAVRRTLALHRIWDGGGRLRFHRLDVLRRLPHPGRGFTQGLIAEDGTVWESTGRYGQSTLRRYRLGERHPEASVRLPDRLFGEGICLAGGHLWQLTWQERVALRWDPASLELLAQVSFSRAGWGIAAAAGQVVTSDGSSELVWRDPASLQPLGVLLVRCGRDRVPGLNDLTWSGGRIWANVLGRDTLAGIDPDSGQVIDIVDARAARERHWGDPQAVMNGIAALAAEGEFLLTGKHWRYLRQVRLVPARRGDPARLLLPDR